VLGRDAIHSPFRHAHVPGIEHLRENLRYLLRMHGAEAVFGEDGIVLQEALHLGLRFEAAGCKALQRFLDDTGERLSRHEHFAAVPGHTVIAIADRRREAPIAIGSARLHAVFGLLGVLLALVLRDRGEKVLDQHAVGIFAKLDGWRFQLAASGRDRRAKLDMRLKSARKAAYVIDDDDVRGRFAMLFEEGQHTKHARAINDAAGCAFIPEHLHDLVAFGTCVIAAARFLRTKAGAARHLLGIGHAAIDNGLRGAWRSHGGRCLSGLGFPFNYLRAGAFCSEGSSGAFALSACI
jgi:hypothetical protein